MTGKAADCDKLDILLWVFPHVVLTAFAGFLAVWSVRHGGSPWPPMLLAIIAVGLTACVVAVARHEWVSR